MVPADAIKPLLLGGLLGMMLAMGLKVKFKEVLGAARQPRLLVLCIVANFALVPAVTLVLLSLFHTDPLVSVGFLILAICPGAPVGPPLAAFAKGDVASAIGQMVILSGLSALLSPALLSILLARVLPNGECQVDYLAIVRTLAFAQILPLAAGLTIHHWAPRFAERAVKPLTLSSQLSLLVALVLILGREYPTLAVIRPRGWFGMSLLFGSSLTIGWLCGGPAWATRKSLALTTAVRNFAVGLVVVSTNFAETPAVTAVISYAFVSILGSRACAALLAILPEPRAKQ